ncbi:CD2 antigen cytoplasmic tail-binding protein 2 [Blastomyces parvus]|uniref:CD2 antigen cytoplasmic tail-binding protein 2 n=1 Tax=Blastomyces parvus TaxID=2060905 RepID=A0A2B7XBN0_9EURO|nr:CD2 antigen cytoplasmic tail-binding protein 2 [Blastomyces parvus]
MAASIPGRPKRTGEDFSRTHHNDPDSDTSGPTSSKRVRFDVRNPSALAPDALEEDAVLDADEIGHRGRRVRRNAVNIEGYDSDSENEGFDARIEAKAKANMKSASRDADDMFAELEDDFGADDADDGTTPGKKKQVRFLQDDEIEGQVYDSRAGGTVTLDLHDGGKGKQVAPAEEEESDSDVDEQERARVGPDVDKELGAGGKKTHVPLLDAFNMRAEQEEGRFDEAGNFVRKATDPDAVHDTWLEGVSRKDMRKAREAAEKREEERRKIQLQQDSILTADILHTLIKNMERGETIIESLARLGKGVKHKPKWQNKYKNRQRSNKNGTEDAELGEDNPDETTRKRVIEEITEAADILLSRGQSEIYDAERELLLRQYKRETGEEWVDPAPAEGSISESKRMTDAPPLWEYRWSDSRDGGEAHGPYDGAMMESWHAAGYFGEGVEFRKVGTVGGWSSTASFT